MKIRADRTGFPLLEVKELGLISIWPVTKVQFECYMSEPNLYGDNWYESLLKLNPRMSCRDIDSACYERLFLTGIRPDEALQFANWLGEDFDLPTIEEWRSFYRISQKMRVPDAGVPSLSVDATSIWGSFGVKKTLRDFTLMREGLVEWVRDGSEYVGVGLPRSSFLANAYNPLNDKILRIEERVFCFGFRLIRRRTS